MVAAAKMVTGGKEKRAGRGSVKNAKKWENRKGVLSTSLKEVGKGDQGASPYIALAL